MNESFTFEGIERVEQAIRGLDEDVAYFILRDYNRKGNAGHVGRLDLEPDAVLKFVPKELLVPAEPDDSTDEFVPSQEEDGSTDDDDGSGDTALDQNQAVAVMLARYEACCALFQGFNWSGWVSGKASQSLSLMPAAQPPYRLAHSYRQHRTGSSLKRHLPLHLPEVSS